MSLSKTIYEVKEVSQWSKNSPMGAHRYVHATTRYANGEVRSWTLELPEDEAYRLAASTGNLNVLMPLVSEAEGANLAFGDMVARGADWACPGVASALQALIRQSNVPKPPYIQGPLMIEIDTDHGTFRLKDEKNQDAFKQFVQWCNYAFPDRK